MSAVLKRTTIKSGALLSAAVLCAISAGAWASETAGTALLFAGDSIGLAANTNSTNTADNPAYPMMLQPPGGLEFDLAGSETRKLQLVLDRPLSLQAGLHSRKLDNGPDMLGLDATVSVPLSKQFSLDAGIDRRLGHNGFQSLGSIQCVNGTLRGDSYTASGCRFVNEPLAASQQQQFNLGAQFDLRNASASVNWFTRSADLSQPAGAGGPVITTDNLLSPNLANPLLAPAASDPLQYLNSEASGVDLNFKVGITTDTRGDLQLGLAFSRVLEADFQGIYSQGADAFSWTLAEPFNSARMNFEWSKGAFSTGIQGYYRDSVDFLNRNSLDSMTTFDVHFTWRTPWNANLSVGASNVLNAGANPAAANAENQPVDPLESIYGRIPYVRYKQDL
jgi:hypothetical protein